VDIPDAVKDELHRRMAPYRGRMPEARWTRPENWHVTIKFLGATYPRLVTEVESAVDAAAEAVTPFESAITVLGAFPSARRARVLWAGLEDKGECLASAARDLDERLCEHFKPEARGLTPHLTLARLRTPINLEDAAPAWIGFPVASAPFTIDRLVLYRSHPSPRGARYEPTYRALFGGG
jgi:RNA 2',3'-cyclic 3'-phosphodiesterase